MLPMNPNVKGSLSFDDMWENWFFGPLRAKKDPIIKPHPRVKQIANFWGTNTITGRNSVNDMKTKKTPVANSKPKYIRDFPDGILLVVDWKFPGKSLTPFETTLNVPETVSLADLTADSRSKPGRRELLSSEALAAAYEFQSDSKEGEDDDDVVCWVLSLAPPAAYFLC